MSSAFVFPAKTTTSMQWSSVQRVCSSRQNSSVCVTVNERFIRNLCRLILVYRSVFALNFFAFHFTTIEARSGVAFLRSTAHFDGSLFRLQVLRSDNLKLMERELFIYFFTDPPRLKRAIAELSARVDAQIVSLK